MYFQSMASCSWQNISRNPCSFVHTFGLVTFEYCDWLGLDQHQKIIYGIEEGDADYDRPVIDFRKVDLFTGKSVIFKKIAFDDVVYQHLWMFYLKHSDYIKWKYSVAISNDGRFIGVLLRRKDQTPNQIMNPTFFFCVLELETGNISTHRFQEVDVLKEFYVDDLPTLRCTRENRWILRKLKKDCMKFYYISCEYNNSLLQINVLIEYKNNIGDSDRNLFLNNQLLIAHLPSLMVDVYDFNKKHWKILATLMRSVNTGLCKVNDARNPDEERCYDMFTQNDDIFAMSNECEKVFLQYDSNFDMWIPMDIKGNFSELNSVLASSSSFIVLTDFSAKLFQYDNDDTPEIPVFHICVLNFRNVLSLRDICFLKLIKCCNIDLESFVYEDIVRNTVFASLPEFLLRCYFGPVWTRQEIIEE